MTRAALILAFACLALPAQAERRFNGDRYELAQGASASDVTRSMRCPTPFSCRPPKAKRHFRYRKHSRRKHHRAPPLTLAGGFQRELARAMPSRFIRGRLICAINVNAYLAAHGIRGTHSALARSFLRWGRPSGPVPGAVAVFSRRGGGHVNIVARVLPNGTVIYHNPSARRQAWVTGPYRRRPIAYRVAA